MDQDYIDEVLGDLQREVLVKGPATVADTLGVSDRTVRDLCPEQSRKHDLHVNFSYSMGPNSNTMTLRELRKAIASETDRGQRINPHQVKWLTGGRDAQALTSSSPTNTLFLTTNHEPHAPADDQAFWERVGFLPSSALPPPEYGDEVVIHVQTGWRHLFETARVYRVYPTLDFILIHPTEDGMEIPELKAAAAGERNSPYPLLAQNYVIVVVGSLPDSYLRNSALMERIRFSSRPLSPHDPGLDSSRQVIWSCPYPGIDV